MRTLGEENIFLKEIFDARTEALGKNAPDDLVCHVLYAQYRYKREQEKAAKSARLK